MLDPGMVSPSIFTRPVLSHVITSGLVFQQFKRAVALGRIVLGMGSTTSASGDCGSTGSSLFTARATGVG